MQNYTRNVFCQFIIPLIHYLHFKHLMLLLIVVGLTEMPAASYANSAIKNSISESSKNIEGHVGAIFNKKSEADIDIEGTVTSADGEVLPGVAVSAYEYQFLEELPSAKYPKTFPTWQPAKKSWSNSFAVYANSLNVIVPKFLLFAVPTNEILQNSTVGIENQNPGW
jgi:hypothetical protein